MSNPGSPSTRPSNGRAVRNVALVLSIVLFAAALLLGIYMVLNADLGIGYIVVEVILVLAAIGCLITASSVDAQTKFAGVRLPWVRVMLLSADADERSDNATKIALSAIENFESKKANRKPQP